MPLAAGRPARRARTAPAFAVLVLAAALACGGGDGDGDGNRSAPTTAPRSAPTTAGPPGRSGGLPATGLGDPYFPDLGAPGIDVRHYDVDLDVDADLLASGTVTLTLRATEDLPRLAIDARSMDVEEVTLDGEPVAFTLEDPELLVTPDRPVAAGATVDLAVTFTDDPTPVDSEGKLGPGWVVAEDHAFTINEPEATRDWLPSLDHPSDKATWRIAVTPPPGTIAVANGVRVSSPPEGQAGAWVWEMDDPMATYLLQVLVGDFVLVEGTAPGGLPLSSAVLRDDAEALAPFLDRVGDQVAFFEEAFGPYPFAAYGVAVVGQPLGLALEQQGRSVFGRDAVDLQVAAHELAHQWFGDAVTASRWDDIWLAESFATYGQWLWLDHTGERALATSATQALADRVERGGPPTGAPTRDEMFGPTVYEGGAVVVHALRREVGDEPFFTLLRRWVAENAGTSRATEDFVALAEEVAGRDLADFFATWLEAEVPPSRFP
ncbi:MAG TPA: M1 family metallopeptidase [Acidimicrobiales bacterium]|nr:M1 family metallopeptidase [Acidimicrobiales bacterium]